MSYRKDVLSYYEAAAEYLGRDTKKEAEKSAERSDGVPSYEEQAAYSLLWFYRSLCKDDWLSSRLLVRALLGDKEGQRELVFKEFDADMVVPSSHFLEEAKNPNLSQLKAIQCALNNPISFVQGPPGTGKTKGVILNLVSCILARGSNVAVVANNSEALRNIEDDVRQPDCDLAACPNRKRLADSLASLGGIGKRREWNEEHPHDNLQFSESKEEYKERCRYETKNWEPKITAEKFLQKYPFITSTVHSLMKNFADGDEFLFDYVIMDEASQASVMLGIIAMSCAKHLVLVGDDEQLAPVYSRDDEPSIRELLEARSLTVPEVPYALKDSDSDDGMSILNAAWQVFEPLGAPRTFLSRHYRCHPGIAQFIAKEIYTNPDEELEICTEDYDRSIDVPIRVRWFGGNYCERSTPSAKYEKGSKRNMRQIEIFMQEEWPSLLERLKEDHSLTVQILTPFREQLNTLKAAIESNLEQSREAENANISLDKAPENDEDKSDPLSAKQLPVLTIHKAQGREYDIVYLLPVEDGDWQWPWSQGKRLVNVAVSRAKKELVIICSTNLMSERVQKELLGAFVEPSVGRGKKMSEEEFDKADAQQRYIQKLIDYVADAGDGNCSFGFHQTQLHSIFDSESLLRQGIVGHGFNASKRPSIPEILFARNLDAIGLEVQGLDWTYGVAMCDCFDNDVLCRLQGNEDESLYEFACQDGTHFDFVVYRSDTREIVLAIEVDGGYHRQSSKENPESLKQQQDNDKHKNKIVEMLGGHVLQGNKQASAKRNLQNGGHSFTLVRLPNDGSSAFEFEGLGDGHADSLRTQYISIQQLIEEQMNCDSKQRVYIRKGARLVKLKEPEVKQMYCLGIKKLLDVCGRYGQQHEVSLLLTIKLTPQEANNLLVKAGYIKREHGGTRPTSKGRALGIREELYTENGNENPYCVYPPESRPEVLRCLRFNYAGIAHCSTETQ